MFELKGPFRYNLKNIRAHIRWGITDKKTKGGKMAKKIKKSAIFTGFVLVVVSAFGLAKHLNFQPGCTLGGGNSVRLMLSSLTHLGTQLRAYLSSCNLLPMMKMTLVDASLFVLVISRLALFKRLTG